MVFTPPFGAAHLRQIENRLTLLSDTEQHGIKVLLPGACLKIRLPDE